MPIPGYNETEDRETDFQQDVMIPIKFPFSLDKTWCKFDDEKPSGLFAELHNYIPEGHVLRARKGINGLSHTPQTTIAPSVGNDFSTDANCLGWYKMDTFSGNLFADSKGSNPVTASNSGISAFITQDLVNTIAPGLTGSISFNNAPTQNSAWGTIAYGDMGTPLPGSVGVNTTFSVCAWARWGQEHAVNNRNQPIVARWRSDLGIRSWSLDKSTSSDSFRFLLRDSGGANSTITSTQTVVTGMWYHIKMTYNSANLTSTMRICNSSGATVFTGNATAPNGMNLGASSLDIGCFNNTPDTAWDGNLQEIVIFNDIVTDAEQDQIIAGTYG